MLLDLNERIEKRGIVGKKYSLKKFMTSKSELCIYFEFLWQKLPFYEVIIVGSSLTRLRVPQTSAWVHTRRTGGTW